MTDRRRRRGPTGKQRVRQIAGYHLISHRTIGGAGATPPVARPESYLRPSSPWSRMRLVVRLLIAGLALASGGTLAGCSGAAGLADAQGATNPVAAVSATPPGRAGTATVPAAAATKIATPAEPTLDVAGAPRGIKAKEGILVDATPGQ